MDRGLSATELGQGRKRIAQDELEAQRRPPIPTSIIIRSRALSLFFSEGDPIHFGILGKPGVAGFEMANLGTAAVSVESLNRTTY